MLIPVFLTLSLLTFSFIFPINNDQQIIVENSNDIQSLIDFINSHIKNNQVVVAMQDTNFDNGFSPNFIKLVMSISKYYKNQGFKVAISPTEEPDIILFSISKIVS